MGLTEGLPANQNPSLEEATFIRDQFIHPLATFAKELTRQRRDLIALITNGSKGNRSFGFANCLGKYLHNGKFDESTFTDASFDNQVDYHAISIDHIKAFKDCCKMPTVPTDDQLFTQFYLKYNVCKVCNVAPTVEVPVSASIK